MRILLGMVIVAGLAWCGWWHIASQKALQFAHTAIAQAQSRGWVIAMDSLERGGFPNRIDLTAGKTQIATPDGQITWEAPFLQAFSLSYKPWHLVTVLPHTQRLTLHNQAFDITAKDLRSSLIVTPNADLGLDRFQIVGEDVTLQGPQTALTLEKLSLATRPALDQQLSHDLGLEVTNLDLGPWADTLGLQVPISRLHVDAMFGFDRALDRHALETPAKVTKILLRQSHLAWDQMVFSLSGEVSPDAKGLTQGHLTLEMKGVDQALSLLDQTFPIEPYQRQLLGMALRGATNAQGLVTLPLTLSQGQIKLGPIPLGPAPRFDI